MPSHRTFATLVLMLAASASGASAQAVRGVLRDAERGRPLPGQRLYLLAAGGVAVDSTFTDAAGHFQLAAPAAGEYAVYFQTDGFATVASEPLRLEADIVTAFEFPVSLVSNAAMRHMSELIATDERLQSSLPEICGEALRPWEAGLLVGVVRRRATDEPVAGARVAVETTTQGVARATLSSDRGIYILCNVPLGTAVRILIEAPDGTTESTDVEIRAGMVSWYDLPIGPARR